MQGATKEEKQGTLDAFLLDDMPEKGMVILDRSTLERAATCPFQAAAIEQGRVNNNSLLTAAGQETHEAISQTIREWIETEGALEPGDIRSSLEGNLRAARPDVQPAAIAGARASTWDIANQIYKIAPENILAFDGGEDLGRSGQLAIDFEPNYRITAELDLLYAGRSLELLHDLDWKSGHKIHSVADVANSFQFNLHALLVFEKYPLDSDGNGVKGLEVKVWDTRVNRQTFSVIFYRHKMADFRIRLINAIGIYEHDVRGPSPSTWPAVEKCSICPAASLCPVSGETIQQIATDPKAALRKLVAIEASGDQLRELLGAYADEHGDIRDGDLAFGRNAPASSRRKPAALYKAPKEEASE